MITTEQFKELVDITVKDMPKLGIDMVLATGDVELVDFIKDNYSEKEIIDAVNRRLDAINRTLKLFGITNETPD